MGVKITDRFVCVNECLCFFFHTILLYIGYIYTKYLTKVTLYILANILVYILKGQYYRNKSWMYFRVVNVLLV